MERKSRIHLQTGGSRLRVRLRGLELEKKLVKYLIKSFPEGQEYRVGLVRKIAVGKDIVQEAREFDFARIGSAETMLYRCRG